MIDINMNIKSNELDSLNKNNFTNPDKIDVEDLIKDFKILNVNNLSAYLKELWKVY